MQDTQPHKDGEKLRKEYVCAVMFHPRKEVSAHDDCREGQTVDGI